MRRILLIILAFYFSTVAILQLTNFGEKLNQTFDELISYSPCEPSLKYKVGDIDKRFKTNENTLLENIEAAEKIWEEPYGKELFVHFPEGTPSAEERLVTINMVYDTRQGLNTQINQLEKSLQSGERKFNASRAQYETKVRDFNARSEELGRKIRKLSINDPEFRQKFDEARQESQALNEEAKVLNLMADELNLSAQEHNKQVNQLNRTINIFNEEIAKRPEEGLYTAETDTIDIYIVNSNAELVHTIAHELGHARGLGHNENPKGIMHPLTSEFIKPTEDDIIALREVCRTRSIFED